MWFHNDRNVGQSPVEKVRANARKLAEILRRHVQEEAKKQGRRGLRINLPYVQGVVLLTGKADTAGIAQNERNSVFAVDDFISKLPNAQARDAMLGVVPWATDEPLTEVGGFWRKALGEFFNVQTGPFRPRQRLYGNYRAQSDDATYVHRGHGHDGSIYREYDVEENAPGRAPGLLRVWDFSQAETRFQTEQGRGEIAGREREVITYLKDRNPEFDIALLQPKDADHEKGVNYWEVFEKRRQLQRLRDARLETKDSISDSNRIELARGLLERIAALHGVDASHLDIGSHSVWFELPSTVKISHLFAASYPTLQSLGEHRYQFLTAGWKLPEDYFGDATDHKRRDVFLLGVTVHGILFGVPPSSANPEAPPDWNADVDSDDRFGELHDWFRRALSWDVADRYADAEQALGAFNSALQKRGNVATTLMRLQRFRRWHDQVEVTEAFPIKEMLRRSDRGLLWKSVLDGTPVIVKLWRRSCWGDDKLEAPRILNFLERAEDLIQTPPAGTARLLSGAFLGDALVLVQEFAKGQTLEEELRDRPQDWESAREVLQFIARLAGTVNDLHESRVSHGDLKPANIIIRRDESEPALPILVDMLEFAPADEGDIVTTAYAPTTGGGRFERDRFAITKIAEEIILKSALSATAVARLATAIQVCRVGPPENATLLPLLDALDTELRPPEQSRPRFHITLLKGPPGPMLSDEGQFSVRINKGGAVVVRGASEEIELTARDGRFIGGRRWSIDQGHIARVAKYEQISFVGDVEVSIGAIADCSALDFILTELSFDDAAASVQSEVLDAESPEAPDDDEAEDELVESAYGPDLPAEIVDVPRLWRALIDVEQELFTEGVAADDSVYNASRKRHLVPFDLERGAFDFARHDRVIVERPRKGVGGWSEVGLLDVEASLPHAIVIENSGRGGYPGPRGPLVRDGDRLRFKSLMETFSRSRRDTATTRILSRQSAIPDLVDYFSPATGKDPHRDLSEKASAAAEETIKQEYGLNSDQSRALIALLSTRPLALLQGPPGTGKTKFIASLVHHVLASGTSAECTAGEPVA